MTVWKRRMIDMSELNKIHIINEKAWTLTKSQMNVLQVAMDHMVEHMEDVVKEFPEVDVYKKRLYEARSIRNMVQPW